MIDQRLLLEFLAYHLPMDLRHKVMAELPHAYNRWIGQEVMETRRRSDNSLVLTADQQWLEHKEEEK